MAEEEDPSKKRNAIEKKQSFVVGEIIVIKPICNIDISVLYGIYYTICNHPQEYECVCVCIFFLTVVKI